jgi:hypothetical protein
MREGRRHGPIIGAAHEIFSSASNPCPPCCLLQAHPPACVSISCEKSQTHNLGAVGPNAESAPRVLAREVRDQRACPSVLQLSKNINKVKRNQDSTHLIVRRGAQRTGTSRGGQAFPNPCGRTSWGPAGWSRGWRRTSSRTCVLKSRARATPPPARARTSPRPRATSGPPIHVRRPRRARQAPPKVPAMWSQATARVRIQRGRTRART